MEPVCSTPLVTVGIPSYNRPDGLRNTLACILEQTYSNLEILVSDNCSPDPAVKKIVDEFAEKDSRIQYIRQDENIGPLQNFLFLAHQAKGEYFMWAADDDWWAPRFIEETASLLNNDPDASVAFTRFAPIENEFSRTKRYPDFYQALQQFTCPDVFERIKRYICRNKGYGKAHIIYGLIRREILLESISEVVTNVSSITDVNDFGPFDVLLNASVLSRGRLAFSEQLLRRFGSAPRKVARRPSQTIWERILSYDGRAMDYYKCYVPLINKMNLSESDKDKLRRAVRREKRLFILERIGRRLFVYKIYWHFVKKLTFRSIDQLVEAS